jgi:hypothetical protein
MEGIQHQVTAKTNHNQRINNSSEITQKDNNTDHAKLEQANQVKRQKLEDISRVGSAKQASPRP